MPAVRKRSRPARTSLRRSVPSHAWASSAFHSAGINIKTEKGFSSFHNSSTFAEGAGGGGSRTEGGGGANTDSSKPEASKSASATEKRQKESPRGTVITSKVAAGVITGRG